MQVKIVTSKFIKDFSNNNDALILQGCGGDLSEWVNGISNLLIEEGILSKNTPFELEDCMSFKNKRLTCLAFPLYEKYDINIGKLAIWRLRTHDNFGGTWLSDFVVNNMR